jgi:hypothetical protein
MPWKGMKTRKVYTSILDEIYADREMILEGYFKSINIKKTIGSEKQLKRLKKRAKNITNFKAEITCLK